MELNTKKSCPKLVRMVTAAPVYRGWAVRSSWKVLTGLVRSGARDQLQPIDWSVEWGQGTAVQCSAVTTGDCSAVQ